MNIHTTPDPNSKATAITTIDSALRTDKIEIKINQKNRKNLLRASSAKSPNNASNEKMFAKGLSAKKKNVRIDKLMIPPVCPVLTNSEIPCCRIIVTHQRDVNNNMPKIVKIPYRIPFYLAHRINR